MQKWDWLLWEGDTLDKYSAMLMPRAYKDLDAIYEYIADSLDVIETAEDIIVELEDVILSLDSLPYRGAKRKVGAFANKGYLGWWDVRTTS